MKKTGSCLLFLIVIVGLFQRCSQSDRSSALTQTDSLDSPDHLPTELLGHLKIETGDLDSMIARRYIRVAVPYSITYYYVDGKNRRGVALELLSLFEKELNKTMNFK